MGDHLGIKQSIYYKLEAGRVKISLERLEQIAEILGKSLEAFLNKKKYKMRLAGLLIKGRSKFIKIIDL